MFDTISEGDWLLFKPIVIISIHANALHATGRIMRGALFFIGKSAVAEEGRGDCRYCKIVRRI